MSQREQTSVSDISSYVQACKSASENDVNFNDFKKNQNYVPILEHTSVEFGQKYLDIILNNLGEQETKKILDKTIKNDIFGGASIVNYKTQKNNFNISPSTLYYTKVWLEIISLFGSLENANIAEIGGGYGGQCLVAKQISNFKSWTIFDLPEVNELQKKYLYKNEIENINYISSPTKNNFLQDFKNYDLVISNYAFSELNREIQEQYLEKVLKKSKKGYMIMNFGWHLPKMFSIEELKKEIPFLTVSEENPKSGPSNCLVTWNNII